ncbi:YraN family protein [Petralouisia muris]|uniref:YraN family protein n=1 Tax=Petralouisia muris TaxID=3032872 RepID=A0AC61RST5_9FIRM|nr:YraN family protein [Petralouisia muris]TGY93679.1 YraN family protein [Petralouisia muris]
MAKAGNQNRSRGMDWERQAAEFLENKGYQILHRNFCSRYGEIDLVARQGRYLVFLEVKYRKDEKGGHPLEAVDRRKQRRICKTAVYYCLRYGYGEDTPCRFDVIGILGTEIMHVEHAFAFLE